MLNGQRVYDGLVSYLTEKSKDIWLQKAVVTIQLKAGGYLAVGALAPIRLPSLAAIPVDRS